MGILKNIYVRYGKRFFDITVTLALAPVLLPLIAVLSFLVRSNLGKPIFFRQVRVGLHGKKFLLHKFRTMSNQCDEHGEILPDSERLGAFGRFLRASSLDELPEFWNILLGHMSLVGPRPLLVEYLDRYTSEQARRHEVRPGLTGWAQVHGRNAIEWDKKFSLDVWYVDHLSAWLDLRILTKTIIQVFRSEGITSQGHASSPKFLGSKVASKKSAIDAKTLTDDTSNHETVSIIGAGGHAKVVAATLLAAGRQIEAFYDDDRTLWGTSNFAGAVRGAIPEPKNRPHGPAILAIGDNDVRRLLSRKLPFRWTCAIHPNAIVHNSVDLAEGVLICAGAIVQPDSRIGAHSIINTGATVDHDSVLGKYVHVAPGVHLAGNVVLEDGVLMGIGSCAAPGTVIGKNTVVGAGAVVVENLPPNCVAVGIPAQVINMRVENEQFKQAA